MGIMQITVFQGPVQCGENSVVAFIGMNWLKYYAATFRGWWDFKENTVTLCSSSAELVS